MYQRLFKGQFFSIILKNFLISVLLISLLCSCVNVEKITYVVILLDPDSYDLQRLRADASFKVNVSLMYNVNWVPVNILGKSNMTNGEIKNLVGKKPEYIQSRIDTLYEVIQYIEIANFKPDTYCDPIDNKIESY